MLLARRHRSRVAVGRMVPTELRPRHSYVSRNARIIDRRSHFTACHAR